MWLNVHGDVFSLSKWAEHAGGRGRSGRAREG
jgi:hypothetical protein